jgi:hypothetical protein
VYSFFILSTWSESSILQFVWPLSYTITPQGYIQTAYSESAASALQLP